MVRKKPLDMEFLDRIIVEMGSERSPWALVKLYINILHDSEISESNHSRVCEVIRKVMVYHSYDLLGEGQKYKKLCNDILRTMDPTSVEAFAFSAD